MKNIGFIGMGIMGRSMARNLLTAGYQLGDWTREGSKTEEGDRDGATGAEAVRATAGESERILRGVSDTPDVEAVVLGEEGGLAGAKKGALVIDCSTISPGATREIAAKLAEKGIRMLDAPVSGGSECAAKGPLSIRVGGDAADV